MGLSKEFQVGSCRICAKSCGDWNYGGTFKTALQHGVYKKTNIYDEGCLKVSGGDDIDEYTEHDMQLCCKPLDIDKSIQNTNMKSISTPEEGEVLEYDFGGVRGRLKASQCKICQEECPGNMVARGYFHLNKIGPFKIKVTKEKNETVAVNEAMAKATQFISIYGYNQQCKAKLKDRGQMQLKPVVYSRQGTLKYEFDPQVVMCCDKMENENDVGVEAMFKDMRLKEQCIKDKDDPKIKKKDFKEKCGKVDLSSFRFKQQGEGGKEEGDKGEGDKGDKGDKAEDSGDQEDAPTAASICAFCRTCDPKKHDVVLSSLMIENIPGTLVLPKKCKEKVLKYDDYLKKFEIPAQIQLCCLKNKNIYEQIRKTIFEEL